MAWIIFPFKDTHARGTCDKCGSRAATACNRKDTPHFFGEFSGWTYLKISSAASPYQECITRERDCLLIANVRDATCESIRWNIYDIVLRFTRLPSGRHRVAFRTEYIFISPLLVIGWYDKLSSRSSARSSYLRAISRSAKKEREKTNGKEERKTANRYITLVRKMSNEANSCTWHRNHRFVFGRRYKDDLEIKWNNWNIFINKRSEFLKKKKKEKERDNFKILIFS